MGRGAIVLPHRAMASLNQTRYKRLLRKLRAARTDAGLSQRDVARRLNKPQSFVQKCETGERRIDPVELAIFAAIYGRPVSAFYEDPS